MTSQQPLTLTVEQAAERLGPVCSVDWLKKAAARGDIPHVKSGNGTGRAGRLGFTETHLAEILLLIERRPADRPAPTGPGEFTGVVTRRRSA